MKKVLRKKTNEKELGQKVGHNGRRSAIIFGRMVEVPLLPNSIASTMKEGKQENISSLLVHFATEALNDGPVHGLTMNGEETTHLLESRGVHRHVHILQCALVFILKLVDGIDNILGRLSSIPCHVNAEVLVVGVVELHVSILKVVNINLDISGHILARLLAGIELVSHAHASSPAKRQHVEKNRW